MKFKFSSPEAADGRFARDSHGFAKNSHAETLYPCGDSRDSRDSHGSRRAHTKNEQLTERELLSVAESRIGSGGLNELRTQAGEDSGRLAELCHLILAAPPAPTAEDVAELDRLIVRLCELEKPWLEGFLPAMQDARRCMAPIHVAENLAKFRRWVAEAEARTTSTH